jgi:hypothetical protein
MVPPPGNFLFPSFDDRSDILLTRGTCLCAPISCVVRHVFEVTNHGRVPEEIVALLKSTQ